MAYDNSAREAAARATRARVMDVARTSFLEHGFASTTIRSVATGADVSQETIYKTFGGKAGLLKTVYDTALGGDDEDIPLRARPEARAVADAAEPVAASLAYARLADLIWRRTGPLLRVLLRSQGSDPALAEFARTIDAERHVGSTLWTGRWHENGWLRPGLDVGRAADLLWAVNSSEPRWLLEDRGWTSEEMIAWFADTLLHSLFDPARWPSDAQA